MKHTVVVAGFDSFADWEPGYLLAELRSGRFTGRPFDVVTAAATLDPVTTMGGLRLLPDVTLEEVDPAAADLLILPGGDIWHTNAGAPFVELASRFLAADKPVGAICGAVFALAAGGLLDTRRHTGAAAEYLAASGYVGTGHYVDERAVVDEEELLVTAGPDSPVQFATATLMALGLLGDEGRQAYEGVFHGADPAAYPALMELAEAFE